MTPYGHVQLTQSDPWSPGGLHGTISAAGYTLDFEDAADGPDAVKKMFAQFLVLMMPAGGLDETLSCLRETYEFHAARQLRIPAKGTQRSEGRVVSVGARAPMTVGE